MTIIYPNNELQLRELTHEDWMDVHRYASQEIVCKYQPWGPNTEGETEAFVRQVINDALQEPRTRYVFAIAIKDHDTPPATRETQAHREF
ncbi:hypothetical protein PaecuDRAFT_3452 [Paenibacillus curdlanolyticus YK9]|uniref:N-acetyltransferase domain-containing protein n=1 Tax=Paenibacillus curdlanolyticus YK9 TaxID=717606 RepID=E0ICR3_9BACL|nr:GNAT family N-acetyltransferase [Paenibacillus curdlanolyticus]EFM09949.1 hypothetical protein PaecuDRAFT_3452 [Paenibacillus curdlanolyticus YK9]